MTTPILDGKASFTLGNHNPDVLTCIANLSNDEVFTPPELANQMLDTVAGAWADANDGAVIWQNPEVTFLDPFTKSGVFLREITARLTEGLVDAIPDLQERVDHILTKQVYGIGITKLTALLARRSVYCSKDARGEHSVVKGFDRDWGNIWFERTEHTWAGEKCAYCGASKSSYGRGSDLESHAYAFIHTTDPRALLARMFGADVQFDVIIGNPPYQLDDGGEGMSASPIYQLFVDQAKQLEPRYLSMIIPSRWMAGGKGLDRFRRMMFADRHLRALVDFPSASDVFGAGIKVKGGVCFFLRDAAASGTTSVTTIRGSRVSGPLERSLDDYDVFVRDVEAVQILEKVLAYREPAVRGMFMGDFGFDTNFNDFHEVEQTGDLAIHVNIGGMGHKRAVRYIDRAQVLRSTDLIDAWKMLAPKAAGYGSQQVPDRVLGRPIVAGPGEVCSRTYRVVSGFRTGDEARSFETYYLTKFFRFLVMLRKITQDAAAKVYTWVPQQTWDREWTDAELYAKYGLDADEIAYVETVIRPMQSGSQDPLREGNV